MVIGGGLTIVLIANAIGPRGKIGFGLFEALTGFFLFFYLLKS